MSGRVVLSPADIVELARELAPATYPMLSPETLQGIARGAGIRYGIPYRADGRDLSPELEAFMIGLYEAAGPDACEADGSIPSVGRLA